MIEFIVGPDPEDPDPWCSECGQEIDRRDQVFWIDKKYCSPLLHGRPWFLDRDGLQVLVCETCFYLDVS